MGLNVRQKRGSQKKAKNMRKGIKEERALSLSLGSLTIIILIIVAVGGGLYLFQGSGGASDTYPPTGVTREFTISAMNWQFNNTSVEVEAGDTVIFNIVGLDDGTGSGHGFSISDFGVNKVIRNGQTVTVEFIADKIGQFDFTCSVFCGAGHADMRGTLSVRPSGSLIDNGPASPEVDQEHPGILATDFSLTDLDGNPFKLSDYRGSVVVIDFMATWCVPCRMEMPHFGTIWEKYGETIVIMSIDIEPNESEQTLRSFSQEFPYATWIWARDTFNLGQPYQVTYIPKTVIIDQDGYIRFTHVGVTSAATFIQEIDQLLL